MEVKKNKMKKSKKTISKEIFIISFAFLLLVVAGGFTLGHFNNGSDDNGSDMMSNGMMSGMGNMMGMMGGMSSDMEEMHERMHGEGGMGMRGGVKNMMKGMSSEEMLEMHESMHGKITNETERQEMLEHMKNCPMMNKED